MEGSQYLHTPPSSEQDDDVIVRPQSYNPYDPDCWVDDEVQEVEEGPQDDEPPSEEAPRKLKRTRAFAEKKPMVRDSEWEDTPDLGSYFAFFDGFDEAAQVKYCRAYANALAAKNPVRNRMRYSHKKQ